MIPTNNLHKNSIKINNNENAKKPHFHYEYFTHFNSTLHKV